MNTERQTLDNATGSSSCNALQLPEEQHALQHFRHCHPADNHLTGNSVLSAMFEDYKLHQVPIKLTELAIRVTQGVSQHYFSGLLYAEFAVKKVVEKTLADCEVEGDTTEVALAIVIKQLKAICEVRHHKLTTSAYEAELAFDYAVLEVSVFLLHQHAPEEGKLWLNRLYML